MASVTQASSTGGKKKKSILTVNHKIDTFRRLEKGDNINVFMHEYNVSSTIYDFKAQKAKLLEFYTRSETNKAANKCRTLHKPKMEQLKLRMNGLLSSVQRECQSQNQC